MIRDKLTSSKLQIRIMYSTIVFLVLFFGITILSYFLLPEGFLLNKNNLTDFNTSSNLFISTIQIFLYNMICTVCIIIASIFAKKKKEEEEYLSLGYWVFTFNLLISAITLGTWSFAHQTASLSLSERILGLFMINKRAGLVEMFGLLLITCTFADKYLVMTLKNKTETRKMENVKWMKQDILCFVLGIVLMFVGALIESRAIIMN